MKALILAAGLGTRLMPYTKTRPKPLFTLGGKPILKLMIDRLIQAGCTDIIINTHHLYQQIERFIKETYFPVHIETRHEPELLNTGGAIKNVRDFMGSSPFFVVNSDIVSDIDLKNVWDFHLQGNWPVTLVMHNYRKFNKVEVNQENFVTDFQGKKTAIQRPEIRLQGTEKNSQKSKEKPHKDFKKKGNAPVCGQLLAFTGIQVLSSEIFKYMPLKNKFSSIDLYTKLANRYGKKVKAYICKNQYWNDIGTIEAYKKACMIDMLYNCHEANKDSSPDYLKVSEILTKDKKYSLINEIFHIKTPTNSFYRQNKTHPMTDGEKYYRYTEEKLNKIKITKLKGDGSCREWFRVKIPDKSLQQLPAAALKSLIVKHLKPESKNNQKIKFDSLIFGYHGICSENIDNNPSPGNINSHFDHKTGDTREIESFVAIGKHLLSIEIPVPKIYSYDFFSGMVALEDLGDTHLQDIINELESEDEIIKWYEKICDHIINFSIKGIKNFKTCWTFQTDAYTKKLILEKECQYFINAFIRGYLKKKTRFKDIKKTCEFIADNALKYSFTGLMHRDMQSRNIMVKNRQIFFIDFQAARTGPLQYDLASLLIDPYVNLQPEIRNKILSYCALKINKITKFDKDNFIQGFKFCAITRNMQILGAFSFLSMVKGKKYFKNYIPCALNTLRTNIDILNHETNGRLAPIKNLLDRI